MIYTVSSSVRSIRFTFTISKKKISSLSTIVGTVSVIGMMSRKSNQMNLEQIKSKIVDGIQTAQKNLGLTLVSEDWGDGPGSKCSCALGCTLVANGLPLSDAGSNITAVSELLGVDEKWTTSFISGFDNSPPDEGWDKPAYNLGTALRTELKPIRFDLYFRELKKKSNES